MKRFRVATALHRTSSTWTQGGSVTADGCKEDCLAITHMYTQKRAATLTHTLSLYTHLESQSFLLGLGALCFLTACHPCPPFFTKIAPAVKKNNNSQTTSVVHQLWDMCIFVMCVNVRVWVFVCKWNSFHIVYSHCEFVTAICVGW